MARRIILTIAAAVLSTILFAGAPDGQKYTVHIVKWYEDISSISAKYGVPEDVIITVNNLKDRKLKTRQELLVPTDEKYWPAASSSNGPDNDADGQEDPSQEAADTLSASPASKIRFALVMPLADANTDGNSMDFYSGALMAARALGNEGLDVEMDVRDLKAPGSLEEGFADDDFIIGPIQQNDMRVLLAKTDSLDVVVSPLDNRSGGTLGRGRRFFVQAGAPSESQWNEAFEWAKEIFGNCDTVKFVIITSDMDMAARREAENAARNAAVPYTVCTTGVQGEINGWELASNAPGSGHNAVILAITNEAVLNNAVRNAGILALQGNVTVFAGSRIRSYDTIPVENIHKGEIHALCPYYVDYSDRATGDFIHQFRALFNTEPSQFAFQGYDLVYYMVKSFAERGKNWKYLVCDGKTTDMLQTSFKIRRAANGVLTNCGMKRVVYGSDCRVRLSK